ncbi:MAG: DUF2851 family protein, partial [Verrucomicrobiae bacterium]|nr:DUF2851 family protein [Verrucomicrobiae bacterium]
PDELEIQARWFGGEYGRHFRGTSGEWIEIVQFGHWNRGAGPDFTEAAVLVDGCLRRGAIELDLDVRNWERHGHGANREFNGTVLHVFTDGPASTRFFTRTEAHGLVSQVLLPQYSGLQGPPDFLPEAFPGRCLVPLSRMVDDEVESLLLAAAQFRIRSKGARLRVMAGSTDPEQAFFQGLAEGLGFRHNKVAMAVLAQRCPLSALCGMDPLEREAWLFGSAGFLGARVFEEARTREAAIYVKNLWSEWWKLRGESDTTPPRALHWRADGTRPLNHPQRRVGVLALVAGQWGSWKRLLDIPGKNLEKHVNNLSKIFDHSFWARHVSISSGALPRPVRMVGRDRLCDLLGNVIFPFAIGVSEDLWEEYIRLRAVGSNQKLRRAALRLFGLDADRKKLFTSYYHQQQGLLQIYEDFCLEDATDCRDCLFPGQLRQWRWDRSFVSGGADRDRLNAVI